MPHLCAKPACAELVEVWLDFAPVSQTVFQRATSTEVSIGLCPQHAARFTVPSGWTFERLESKTSSVEPEFEPSSPAEALGDGVNRQHHKGRPWFLALREESPSSAQRAQRAASIVSETDELAPTDADEHSEPTTGSLLHRAFHGPDRDADMARAIQVHQDELESRRSARSPANAKANGHEAAELPFPPFEPEHRAAVS